MNYKSEGHLLQHHRGMAHGEFDRLWKLGLMSRTGAYAWLSLEMGLSPEKAHISLFTSEQCKEVQRLAGRKVRALKAAGGAL